MQTVYLSLIAAPIMVVLDLGWAAIVANKFYRSQLGSLFTNHIIVWPIVAFYLIYVFAIGYFVLTPAIAAHSFMRAALGGALLGLTAYGTYDLVNLSITSNWPLTMSLVDIVWGVVVTSVVSSAAYLIATKFFGF